MNASAAARLTYAFCPSSPAAQTPERIAIDAFLCAHGYRRAQKGDTSPDLLVVAPPPPEDALAKVHLESQHLRVFQQGVRGRVLYIQPELTTRSTSGAQPEASGYFVLGNRSQDNLNDLYVWLQKAPQWTKTEAFAHISTVLNLVYSTLYDALTADTRKHFLTFVAKEFPGSGLKRLSHAPWWDDLYAFHHIAGSYDVLEHDLNRYARHSLSQTAQGHQKIRQKRETLNVAADLWNSLTVLDAFRRDDARRGKNDRSCLFLVDDNPNKIKDEITPVVAALMPGYDILCWNPNEAAVGGAADTFDHIVQYSSLAAGKDKVEESTHVGAVRVIAKQPFSGRNLKMTVWSMADGVVTETPKEESLDSALGRSRFVLVDLLFKRKGSEGEYGAALIRGLRRFCVDHQREAQKGRLLLPRFVAFSRSDDLERIQGALRAGASGYVLKHRLLSLPAELARLRYGNGKGACLLHRNFHALDFLPNETHGLLHEVKIPRWRFDRLNPPSQAAALCSLEARKRMADLLRAVPKPDLHLHVGSCMTPEFLAIASILMLAERVSKNPAFLDGLLPLFGFWLGKTELKLADTLGASLLKFGISAGGACAINHCDPVHNFGTCIRSALKKAIWQDARTRSQSSKDLTVRSLLHEKLNIRDHWTAKRACDELDTKDAVSLMFFAIITGSIKYDSKSWSCSKEITKEDVLRLFILFWVSHYDNERVRVVIAGQNIYGPLRDLKNLMDSGEATNCTDPLERLKGCLVALGTSVDLQRLDMPNSLSLDVSLLIPLDPLRGCPPLQESPLEFLIASGTRGRTLAEYLAGCEYAGAEHLRRPGLMGLYARQTLEYLVRYGVLYAELRSAVSGYASKDKDKEGMTYQEACTKFKTAFGTEQLEMMDAYRDSGAKSARKEVARQNEQTHGWTWCAVGDRGGVWSSVFWNVRASDPVKRLFPAKVNLIFTGKRHKATREMLMEAAAGVMLNSESKSEPIAASEFTTENMTRCRVVGFDLAGLEESFPPEMFRAQFEQLSRMHIPITAHAGENASAHFVESAVLDLRARRLGHGLALADDPKLMARVREERICIELCPVSNYQTNEFAETKPGREYPLRKFLEFGNIVCLNTDNPIVSYTNIVKEFFQASYAYGGDGLSLWDALRMIRMGFAHAFKGLAERRALIELVEQMIFDLLIDPSVLDLLRKQVNEAASEKGSK